MSDDVKAYASIGGAIFLITFPLCFLISLALYAMPVVPPHVIAEIGPCKVWRMRPPHGANAVTTTICPQSSGLAPQPTETSVERVQGATAVTKQVKTGGSR